MLNKVSFVLSRIQSPQHLETLRLSRRVRVATFAVLVGLSASCSSLFIPSTSINLSDRGEKKERKTLTFHETHTGRQLYAGKVQAPPSAVAITHKNADQSVRSSVCCRFKEKSCSLCRRAHQNSGFSTSKQTLVSCLGSLGAWGGGG